MYFFPAVAGRRILPWVQSETFFFSFELIQRGIEQGMTWTHAYIECRPREAGSSKVFNVRRLRRVSAEVFDFANRRRRERRG